VTITTNILNTGKLMEIYLITKNQTMFTHPPSCSYGHQTCLMTFDLTQLLLLADCDIVCVACEISLCTGVPKVFAQGHDLIRSNSRK